MRENRTTGQRSWEKELSRIFTEREWGEIYNWACTTVRDAASREPALKISTYWYNTTTKLQALDLYIAAGMDVRKQAHYNVHLPWSYPQLSHIEMWSWVH